MTQPVLTSRLVQAYGYLRGVGHGVRGTDQVLKQNNLGMHNGFRLQTSSPTGPIRGTF